MPEASEVRDYYTETFQVRDVGTDGRREIEVVATRYGTTIDTGRGFTETMRRGVFDETLSRHADSIKLIVGHDAAVPGVGTPVHWDRNDDELRAVFRFGSHEQARQAAQMADEGMFGGVSVGFLPGRKDGDNIVSRGDGGMPHVERVRARLLHLGLVTQPAMLDAAVVAVRSAGLPAEFIQPRLFEAQLILERMRSGR